MLKTISAALLGVAVLAAPVLAATPAKKAQPPVAATTQAPAAKTTQAPVIKADRTKSKAMNANAKMKKTSKAAVKPAAPKKPATSG
jgi:hypothetical protein